LIYYFPPALKSKQENSPATFFSGSGAKRVRARAQWMIFSCGVSPDMKIAGGQSYPGGVEKVGLALPFLASQDCYVFVIPVPRKGLPFLRLR
jgi:hypothetical protein